MADDDVHRILETLKYTNADGLKATQSKLSAARNTILDEAMGNRYRGFFTDEELSSLSTAAQILGSFRKKVEHAKEIRAREEKLRTAHLNKCKAQRSRLLDMAFPTLTSIEHHREAVLFNLALQENGSQISKRGHYNHGIGYVEDDLNRALDPKYPHLTVQHVGSSCWRESYRWLEENLWRHDVDPEPGLLDSIMQSYRQQWRSEILKLFKPFLDRYFAALAEEMDKESAAKRATNAVKRRSQIKVVKSGD